MREATCASYEPTAQWKRGPDGAARSRTARRGRRLRHPADIADARPVPRPKRTGGRVALYDLETDRREKRDLAAPRPIALRFARNVFAYQQAYGEKWHKTQWGVASDLKPAFVDDIGM